MTQDLLKNTPTPAGQTKVGGTLSEKQKSEVVNAINQMFAEFELVYHNQFHKAFSSEEKLSWTKRLWFDNLKMFTCEQILDATHQAIRKSEYLPTVCGVIKYIDALHGLPDARAAYIEACNAPHPKAEQSWSHPVVYFAGDATGWFFIDNNPEVKTWPPFEKNYEAFCERVYRGEEFHLPDLPALPETISSPMTAHERKEALKKLRDSLA
ncbi:MAG: hypothetical protein KDI30_13295 [Pseudomonadales bacterium]|nr:hypothetical protein [Pseudomonadales bacterium]